MMTLAKQQLTEYDEKGYLLVENLFNQEEIQAMTAELPDLFALDVPHKILEKTGAVRSFFAAETFSDTFRRATQVSKLVNATRQLLKAEDLYVHQTKINVKEAMLGDWWEWHQDFPYWYIEDAMPQPCVLTAMVFLDDATEFNGPMLVIPGSHKAGIVDATYKGEDTNESESFLAYQRSKPYMNALTAKLKYTVGKEALGQWADRNGIVAVKGKAGSVLFFHGLVFHASSNNMSPYDRKTFLVTYNCVDNKLGNVENPRPAFIANRDFSPLQTCSSMLERTEVALS